MRGRAAVPALLLVLGVLLTELTGCGSDRHPAPAPSTGRSVVPLPQPQPVPTRSVPIVPPKDPLPGGPVRPPEHGALLGAYAQPRPITQSGRIRAVVDLQGELGRPLDVVHTYHRWRDMFGTESDMAFQQSGATLLYSWAGTDTRKIVDGRYDRLITERARQIRSMGRPILLEWRWEMDRPNLRYEVASPATYIAAWRHLRSIFATQHVRNASWVWCPTADGFGPSGDAAAFYPGDAYVDWLCVDAYPGRRVRSLSTVLDPFLAWAQKHPRPIIVGEFGAPKSYGSRARARWLADAAAELRSDRQIKAACYYDSNPVRDKPVEGYGLRQDPAALAEFSELANDPYFNPRHR